MGLVCFAIYIEMKLQKNMTLLRYIEVQMMMRTNCTIVQMYLMKEAMLRNQADIVYFVISRHSRTVGLVCVYRHRCFQKVSIFRLEMMLWNDWST